MKLFRTITLSIVAAVTLLSAAAFVPEASANPGRGYGGYRNGYVPYRYATGSNYGYRAYVNGYGGYAYGRSTFVYYRVSPYGGWVLGGAYADFGQASLLMNQYRAMGYDAFVR